MGKKRDRQPKQSDGGLGNELCPGAVGDLAGRGNGASNWIARVFTDHRQFDRRLYCSYLDRAGRRCRSAARAKGQSDACCRCLLRCVLPWRFAARLEPEEFAVDRRDVYRATRRTAPEPRRRPASQSARERLPQVDRRSDEDLRKVLAHYNKYPPRIANVSLLLPAIEAGLLPRFLPLSWPADAILSGCNEGDQRQYPIFRTDRFRFNNEDWVYLWDREKAMLVGDSFAVGGPLKIASFTLRCAKLGWK